MSGGMLGFLHSQLFTSLPIPKESYAGKTVLVTGSNVGLGKEAAKHFARLHASTVILAVRSTEKGNAAKQEIESSTKCSPDVIKVWKLDMANYQSVIDFSSRVSKELPRLDTAILNAGIATTKFAILENDESDITVNVVSTFLLALLLFPKLNDTAAKFHTRPNLTIVASEVHFWAKFPEQHAPEGGIFDKLNEDNGNVDMENRYQVSKLLDVLCTRAMADRKSASQIPVTINYVNPGLCHSELGRELGFAFKVFKFFVARSTEAGSRTLVHAATQGPETHGEYMSDCKITQPSSFVLSKEGYEAQNRVWSELTKKLEAIKPGVTKNL